MAGGAVPWHHLTRAALCTILISMDIDMNIELAAVSRGLTTTTRDGEQVRLLTIERTYAAPAGDVWSALTDPSRIKRWLAPVSGDLELGGRYQIEGNAAGTVLGCEPPAQLSITWEFGGHVSWVDVLLAEDGEGTRLRLEHYAPSAPTHWDDFGPGAVGIGWELALMGLGLHLTAPERPRPEPDELPDLTALMTAAGTAWGEEAVAAGEDPAAARAAAERCIAAYTTPPGTDS